ncbi:helix-hairpin-helix domain-containing protein [Butyrivibrio sp. XBB1001]|uniref:helix-hairpin-helix domain-containing protein n=1 Tax=Butyrivibrio sp. XBB1001 TaxID=1280682 RepID=UPI0004138FB6|nr:helix-hairpin-helix domain-containing protein [Butyrivibrio sp. XBB1001]
MRNILITVLVLMMVLTGCRRADSAEVILTDDSLESASIQITDDDNEALARETSDGGTSDKELVIFVCGAVNEPGVYYLKEGHRAVDAIEAAGGFSEDADKTIVNLAAPLSDGIKLQIPTKEEAAGALADGRSFDSAIDGSLGNCSSQVSDGSLVNINRASIDELKTLPGIGDGIAGKIVDYRSENGNFTCIEDIMKVSGIKDKLFSKIKDHITV